MSIESLYPFAGDHAIQSAVFALEFEHPLTEAALKELEQEATTHLSKELPQLQPLQTMALNIEGRVGGQVEGMRATQQYGGFVLARGSSIPGQAARQISVTGNTILTVISDYTSWTERVKPDIDRYCGVLLPTLQKHGVPLSTMGLQYTDTFNWRADPKTLDLSEVLQRQSPYVSSNIFDLEKGSVWHSHHGYFKSVTVPVSYRRLDNINVSRVDTDQAHALQILTSHKAQLAEPIYDFEGQRGVISTIQDQIHDENKRLLGLLLTEAVAAKIKLFKGAK